MDFPKIVICIHIKAFPDYMKSIHHKD